MKSMFVAIFASIIAITSPAIAEDYMVVSSLDVASYEETTVPFQVTVVPDTTVYQPAEAARLRDLNLAFAGDETVTQKRDWRHRALPINGQRWETLVIDWKSELGDPKIAADAGRGRIAFVVKEVKPGFDPSPYNSADKGLKDLIGVTWKMRWGDRNNPNYDRL